MARVPEAEPIYAAADDWKKRCLTGSGSIFAPNQHLWTVENIAALRDAFTANPLTGPDSFLEKFQQQLSNQPGSVVDLAAEMLWVLFLFPRKLLSPERKRELISTVWGWSPARVGGRPYLDDAVLVGLGSAGTAFNTQRDQELEGLIDIILTLKQKPFREIDTPWQAAEVIDSVPKGARRNIRNLLLHLLYPDEFERIASLARKREIVKAFHSRIDKERFATPSPAVEVDRDLLKIRRVLEREYPGKFDFYDPDIRPLWDVPKPKPAQARGHMLPPPEAFESAYEGAVPPPAVSNKRELQQHRAPYTGPELNDYAWAGVALAHGLASKAGMPEPGAALLLSAYLLLTEDPNYTSHAANTLVSEIATSPSISFSRSEAIHLFLRPRIRHRSDFETPSMDRFEPGPQVYDILLAAEGVRRRVAPAKKSVSARHVLGALLLPTTPHWAGPALEEQGVDPARLRRAVLSYVATEEVDDHAAWASLLQVSESNLVPASASDLPLYAGFSTDALPADPRRGLSREDDRLDVMKDVTALCEVLAAYDTRPPLAVGLFGDWGTGKSFFMELMKKEIEYLGEKNPSFYCSRVVQVWFNAWHYMDTDLWASLAARVFEALARQLEAWDDAPDLRRNLFEKLQESRGVLAEAVEQKKDAEARIAAIHAERAAVSRTVTGTARIALQAAASTLAADPQVQQQLREAGNRLGLPDAQVQVERAGEQAREFQSLGKRSAAIARGLLREPLFLVPGIVVFAAVLVAVPWVLERFEVPPQAAHLVAQAMAFIAALVTALGPISHKITRAVRWMEDVGTRLNQQRDARQRQEELALQRELMRLDEREREAQAQVDALSREIEELRAGRRLQRFIIERHTSAEYRQHLGIVNLIRNDFEQLSSLLSESERERAEYSPVDKAEKPLPRIDRIILYIDDLDRCPEDRVVQVLQAVHLLLAFPLFVVVVGVDSRWLLLSLEDHYTALRGRVGERRDDGNPDGEWSTTPQNYLEKIFQIPFTLRPMESTGFGSLVEALLPLSRPTPGEPAAAEAPNRVSAETASHEITEDVPADDELDAADDDGETEDEEGPVTVAGIAPPEDTPAPVPPNPQGLTVARWEREFIRKLHPLIMSPRALKRFTNVYRFIRVQQRGAELDRFRGTEHQPGEFQVVALLLAAIVGYPAEATPLLRRLVTSPGEPWWDVVKRTGAEQKPIDAGAPADAATAPRIDGEHGRPTLRQALQEVKRTVPMTTYPPETFARWARDVARFSFQSGRILSVRDTAERPPPPASAASS